MIAASRGLLPTALLSRSLRPYTKFLTSRTESVKLRISVLENAYVLEKKVFKKVLKVFKIDF